MNRLGALSEANSGGALPRDHDLRVLGRLRVGTEDLAPSTKAGALFAMVAADANRVVPVDRIAEALWAGRPPPSYRAAIQVHMSGLRSLLAACSRPDIALVGHRGGYELVAPVGALDLTSFEAAAREGCRLSERDQLLEAAPLLDAAIAWYATPFAGLDLSELDDTRRYLSEWHARAVDVRSRGRVRLGQVDVPLLRAEVAAEPLREGRWATLMIALYQNGQQAEALRVFQDCAQYLRDEVGLEPTPMLRAVEERILLQADDLAPTRPMPWPRPPRAVGAMVGRAEALAGVLDASRRHRLVTVVGHPGVGKTRLLQALAETDATRTFAWVGLAGVSATEAFDDELVARLGIANEAGADEVDVVGLIIRRIGETALVLLVDNAEHVVAELTPVLERLLRSCPALHVVASSRTPLGSPGEVVIPVEPLDIVGGAAGRSGAVALLVDLGGLDESRARRYQPELERIGREVGGLPLGLVHMAARLRVMEPDEVCHLLDQGGSTGEWLHTVDRSLSLLSPQERRLLSGLAWFAESWDLASGVTLASRLGLERSAGPVLIERLLNNSLVVRVHGEDHALRILEPVRNSVLQPTDETAAAAYQAAVVERAERAARHLHGEDQRRGLDEFAGAIPDIRAGVRLAVARGDVATAARLMAAARLWWWASGTYAEGQRLAAESRAALEHGARREDEDLAHVCVAGMLGAALASPGFTGAAEQLPLLMVAVEEADRCPRALPEQSMARALAAVGLSFGNAEVSRSLLLAEEAVRRAARAGDQWTLAWATHALGLVRGRVAPEDTLELFGRAAAMWLEVGDRLSAARIYMFIGHALRLFGVPGESERAYRDAEEICVDLRAAPITQLDCALGRAQTLDQAGRMAEAEVAYRSVAERLADVGDVRCAAVAHRGLASALWARGDREGALRLLDRVGVVLRKVGEQTEESAALLVRARIARDGGETRLTAKLVGRARRLSSGAGLPLELRDQALLDELEAWVDDELGDHGAALRRAGADDEFL